METGLTLKNEMAQFNALKKSAEDMASQCSLLTITDDNTRAIATQQLSLANEKIKQIDKVRTDLKAPYFQAGKEIDSLAKALSLPLEKVLADGKAKIVAYNIAEQKKQQAEISRIQYIKTFISDYSTKALGLMDKATTIEELTTVYNDYVKTFPIDERFAEFLPDATAMRENIRLYASSRKIAINTPAEVDASESEAIKELIAENVSDIGINEVAEAVIGVTEQKGMRQNWKAELVDVHAANPDYLMLDDKKIKEYIKRTDMDKNFKDGEVVAGIKFYIEHKVTIR